jgi:hypothetical protein
MSRGNGWYLPVALLAILVAEGGPRAFGDEPRPRGKLEGKHEWPITSLTFSPDPRRSR